ncbi:TIGR02117 family protein [Sphingomonas koreensis]|nr:TIGR02117 family protein [Sphingomonas koreensis]
MSINWPKARRRAVDALLVLVALIAAYGAAGFVGGAIPANAGWRPPAQGIRIYVETNGVHTDLVVPVVAAGIDWRALIRPGDIADPRYAAYDHLAFGWGERDFYLKTPHWADVRPGTVLHAAFGSDHTLVHVEHLPAPAPGPDMREITLSPAQYRRLAGFIRASFAPAPAGAPPAVFHGYGDYDAFYSGSGRYDALMTCNAWTGAALRKAGVRIGRWTPFATTVMGWF